MTLDQFKGACWGMDQETRATLQTQPKAWASHLFSTGVFVWVESGVSLEKAHYQGIVSWNAPAEVQAHSRLNT